MPQQAPFGDIFAISTPHLDRLENRLYAQEQQRQALRIKELQSLDDDFKRSVTNIRSADIPEFTKLYNDYRNARISQLRTPSTNREEYLKQQQDINEKLARAYSILNDSVTEKAREKDLANKVHSNWKNYTDNASLWIKTRMGIPTSKLSEMGYDSEEPILYKGGFDFSKNIKDAFGTNRDLGTIDETTDPKAIQKTFGKYKGFNSPYLAYQQLVNSLNDPRKADAFIKTHQFTPIQEQQIEQRFNEIVGDKKYSSLYGLNGGDNFPADDTELGHAAKMAIMLATMKPSREEILKTDQENTMAQRQRYAQANIRLAAALRNYNSKDYYNYREGKDKEKTEGILNGLIDKQYNSGKRALMDVDGKSYSGNVVPASTIGKTVNLPTYQYLDKTKNAYELPTEFLITDDKQTIIPIFRDKKGNSEGIKSKPIPISTYKLDLGNTYLTRKDSKDELISDLEKEVEPAKSNQPRKKKRYNPQTGKFE